MLDIKLTRSYYLLKDRKSDGHTKCKERKCVSQKRLNVYLIRYDKICKLIKGTVHHFYIGGPRNRLQFRNIVYFKVLFSIPVAATVDFMVSRISPKRSTSNSNCVIGHIRDTIHSLQEQGISCWLSKAYT